MAFRDKASIRPSLFGAISGVTRLAVRKPRWALTNAPQILSVWRGFDACSYLDANPDVAASGMDPLRHYIEYGSGERRSVSAKAKSNKYRNWIERYDVDEEGLESLRQQIEAMDDAPLISVLMPVYNTPPRLLREAIESVCSQIYPRWELCIADDCSTDPAIRKVLEHYSSDSRIKIEYRKENGHISAATNTAFELAAGEWIALLDHDDLLRTHALAEVALEIKRFPDAQIIYSDEDKLDRKGRRFAPYFKPDYSRELFRSQNYFNHLTVHRASNVRRVGGWRQGFEGSQDYDLSLRILEVIDPENVRHIPKVLYHWRAAEESVAAGGAAKPYAFEAGLRALQEHLSRCQPGARVERAGPDLDYYRVVMPVPTDEPLVSLIIPTRDRCDLLRNCIESIRSRTSYRKYEIIVVDNASTELDALAYLEELSKQEGVRILRYDGVFNYSAINNFAVSHAKGSIIGLINNDIEVISEDWLREMVSWVCLPEVGCVGAKLYYANGRIQHGGVILVGGVAGHSHKHFHRNASGYFGRLKQLQNLSAVTAACLLVRKQVYLDVGGLDEVNLTVAFNDVDLCLRVREAGYSNVWTPYAELYHLESVSRGHDDNPVKAERFNREVAYMKDRWGDLLKSDPFYSPNLSMAHEDFSLKR